MFFIHRVHAMFFIRRVHAMFCIHGDNVHDSLRN